MSRSPVSTPVSAVLAAAGSVLAVPAGAATFDVGERNPDGTVFYRTADFQFTR